MEKFYASGKTRTPAPYLQPMHLKVAFWATLCIAVPIWLWTLVPLAIFYYLFINRNCFKRRAKTRAQGSEPPTEELTELPKFTNPKESRLYDIIIVGATGFTGKLLCEYYAKNYSSQDTNLTWAIAGRNSSRLIELKAKLVRIDPKNKKLQDLPTLVADNQNLEDMKCLANHARVIVSCAGPFGKFGSVLVNCCAAYGTDYVDITGEIDWVRQCIVKYGDLAVLSGARIVSCCGFDCVPSDLLFYKLDQRLKEKYGEDTEIGSLEIWDEGFFAGLSGGTVNSLFNSFEGRQDGTKSGIGLGFDPLNKMNSSKHPITGQLEKITQPAQGKAINLSRKYMHYDIMTGKWCGFNFIILQNFRMIQRTNSLMGITKKLLYTEKIVYNNFMTGFLQNFMDFFIVTVFTIGFLKDFTRKYLPSSGEGPDVSK